MRFVGLLLLLTPLLSGCLGFTKREGTLYNDPRFAGRMSYSNHVLAISTPDGNWHWHDFYGIYYAEGTHDFNLFLPEAAAEYSKFTAAQITVIDRSTDGTVDIDAGYVEIDCDKHVAVVELHTLQGDFFGNGRYPLFEDARVQPKGKSCNQEKTYPMSGGDFHQNRHQ